MVSWFGLGSADLEPIKLAVVKIEFRAALWRPVPTYMADPNPHYQLRT